MADGVSSRKGCQSCLTDFDDLGRYLRQDNGAMLWGWRVGAGAVCGYRGRHLVDEDGHRGFLQRAKVEMGLRCDSGQKREREER